MAASDIAQAFNTALNAQQWESVAGYLTDDFIFAGATPQPVGKAEFIGAQRQWAVGVPDWHVVLENLSEAGDTVRATARITGTQTDTLALPGQPQLPASGKRFSATAATMMTTRANQIAALTITFDEPSILAQLGMPGA